MNKPKFDPNQPYQAVDKPKFDPSQAYQEGNATTSQPKEDISQLESLLKGAEQGATFGGADELAGAVYGSPLGGLKTATGGLLGMDVSQDPDVQKYVQARNESRAGFKAAEEANPKTYMAGDVGAGIATSFIPGLGELNAAKLAAMGAGAGALTSNADLSKGEVGNLSKDAAISGAIGGTLGTIPAIANKAQDIAFVKKPIEAFKRGFFKEQNLVGESARRGAENELFGFAKQTGQDIQQGLEGQAMAKKAALERLSGSKVDIEKAIKDTQNELEILPKDSVEYKNATQKLQDLIDNFTQGQEKKVGGEVIREGGEGYTPTIKRADDLRKELNYLAESESVPKEVKSLAQRLQGKVSEGINLTDSELAEINSNIQKYTQAKDLLGLSYKPGDLESQKKLGPLFNRLEKEGVSGGVARAQFEEAMKVLKDANPELAQKIETSGMDLAEKYDLVNRINSEGVGLSKFLGFSLPGATTGLGNVAGLALGKAVPDVAKETIAKGTMGALKTPFTRAITGEITANAPDIRKSTAAPTTHLNSNSNYKDQMFNNPDDQLKTQAQKLINSKQKIMMGIGTKLNKAIDDNDTVGKNAVLNVIMQNPNLRKYFSGEENEQ